MGHEISLCHGLAGAGWLGRQVGDFFIQSESKNRDQKFFSSERLCWTRHWNQQNKSTLSERL